MIPYLIGDSIYRIHTYLQKRLSHISNDVDKKYDNSMNFGNVIINKVFQVFEELVYNL
jgi:hypothetical protein